MNPGKLWATARRVLTQLRHDPRTVVLMVAVPSLLMILLRFVFDSAAVFDHVAAALLGFFPFLMMFLITSITMLRERTSGTLDRLLTTPMSKLDLLGGYAVAFTAVAAAQVGLAVLTSVQLGLAIAGALGWLFLVALLNAVLGVALGLLASAFAHSEFQAVQFMPVVVLPQLLLCGLLQPRDHMATGLQWASDVMPLSYAVDALQRISTSTSLGGAYWLDVTVLLACALAGLVAGAATLRRRAN